MIKPLVATLRARGLLKPLRKWANIDPALAASLGLDADSEAIAEVFMAYRGRYVDKQLMKAYEPVLRKGGLIK